MVSGVAKKMTKNGKAMGIVTVEDLESEITIVVFPKTYAEAEPILLGEVDEQTGESQGDVFVRVLGKVERGDRGTQFIAQKIEPIELNGESNKQKEVEIFLQIGRASCRERVSSPV